MAVENGDEFVVIPEPPNMEGAGVDPNGAGVPPNGAAAEPNGVGAGDGDPNGDGDNTDCCGFPNGVLLDDAEFVDIPKVDDAEPKADDDGCVPNNEDEPGVGAANGLVCC